MKSIVSIPSFIFGTILALLTLFTWVIIKEVLWPILKWIVVFAFKKIRKALTKKPKKETPKFIAELPTPEVFKGSTNLAKARQMDLANIIK